MTKKTGKNQNSDSVLDRDDNVRHSLDEQGQDVEKFDPRTGEDPGALELNEDPLERRMKRNTM